MTTTLTGWSSYPADHDDGAASDLDDFHVALSLLCDELNEPYGWGWLGHPADEDADVSEPMRFCVYFVMPRKGSTFTISIEATHDQDEALHAIVAETVGARVKEIWGRFL